MKTLALDIGDRWIGVALSDPLGILSRPYDTVKAHELKKFLDMITLKEPISTIVVGLPTTLRGTQSEQTKKIIAEKDSLEKEYSTITWILWDERFTSRQAASIKPAKTKEDKLKSHAIAAALILSNYLEFKRMQTPADDNFY